MAAVADERTTVSVGERSVPLEIYAPADGPGPHAAVLVICESFGLNDDIRRISRRFADNGYLAAAPDLLSGGLHIRCVLRAMSALRKGRGQAVDDLEATIAQMQAAGLELVDPQPREDRQGRRVFLHPRSGGGVLMGFVERHPGQVP
jgi:dienelactone hydrolase